MSEYARGENPNQLAALREYGPKKGGPSRNPGGLPRGTPKVSVALGKLLRTEAREAYPIVNKADALAVALYKRALGGDVAAIREVLDRTEGKVSQQVRVGVAGPEQLSDAELEEQLRAALTARGLSEAEADRFLLVMGSDDDGVA